MDDISEWLDPPPLKRTSPDSHLNDLLNDNKTRKIEDNLPAFLRNQSVEELETEDKHNTPPPFYRHYSIPDNCDLQNDSDNSSDDELDIQIDCHPKLITDIVKNNILAKKASYDFTCAKPEEKEQRVDPKCEKNSLAKKLLMSPKLSRLFKPSADSKEEDKSKSKFFVQRPASPRYRVRPSGDDTINKDVLKSDLKLASLGKPMTPIFRRHIGEKQDFEGRYSYRDKEKMDRRKLEPVRNLTPLLEKKDEKPKKREGIKRSNYVRLANLKITKELEPQADERKSPPERVI